MLQKLNKGQGKAVGIDTIKKVVGYLVGVQWTPAKKNKKGKVVREPSPIFTFQDKATGLRQEIWGCAAINQQLLDGNKLDPALTGALVQCKFLGLRKLPGRAQPMKDVEVMADPGDRLGGRKGGKVYQLKK